MSSGVCGRFCARRRCTTPDDAVIRDFAFARAHRLSRDYRDLEHEPLAINWSSEGPGYLFGVVSRKVIGTGCVLALTRILRKPIAWDAHALHVYLVSGSAIYGAMLAVYWGAQFIPSGWISIIFGLTPIITTAMAAVWLDEPMLT